ncbi:ubiquitin-conjugating enzyme E2 S [Coemansia sp. RSA 922]|nr:ubiquitin-conjugating enzyme E2 S [Coemansia sp. RSA 922]
MAQRLDASTVRRLVSELGKLQSTPPEGIAVTMNEDSLTEINALLEGPQGTPYEGGKFHIRLTIDEGYPSTPPKGVFVTKIFHPNVSEHGEICVNTLKKDWQKHYGIEHVLVTVKCLLIYPNPESALNEEAGKLLLERYDDYATRARIMTGVHAKPKGETGGGAENRDPAVGAAVKDKKKNLKRF